MNFFLSLYCSIILSCCLLFTNCRNTANSANITTVNAFSYRIDEPARIFELPKSLKEISGLTIYKNKWLIAVQDEKGILFLINKANGSLDRMVNFSADGDYEDIVCVGEWLYVLRADGVLFRITNWRKEKNILATVLDTNLGENNDTEGLAYDVDSNNLIIMCKASAVIGEKVNKRRAAYTYDLDRMEFNVEPFFEVSRKAFKHYLKDSLKGTEDYDRFKKKLKQAKKDMPLQPSAIAIHPVTKDIYILAAVGNALLVLNPDKTIKYCQYLHPDLFEQPEGLTFDKNGDMYIASESKKHQAVIYKFRYLE